MQYRLGVELEGAADLRPHDVNSCGRIAAPGAAENDAQSRSTLWKESVSSSDCAARGSAHNQAIDSDVGVQLADCLQWH